MQTFVDFLGEHFLVLGLICSVCFTLFSVIALKSGTPENRCAVAISNFVVYCCFVIGLLSGILACLSVLIKFLRAVFHHSWTFQLLATITSCLFDTPSRYCSSLVMEFSSLSKRLPTRGILYGWSFVFFWPSAHLWEDAEMPSERAATPNHPQLNGNHFR